MIGGVAATYKLVVGVSVVVDDADAERGVNLVRGTDPHLAEVTPPERSNAGPGEAEIQAVFEFSNSPPADGRLDRLREGALLAGVAAVTRALRSGGIASEVTAWGCKDPQTGDRVG